MNRDAFLATLESFKGIRENPPGSNRTPIGEEFGWNGVAWCAESVSVACKRNGFPLHEAAVIRIEQHAKAGDWGMGWSRVPVVGAASIFDWEGRGNPADMHVGVVKEDLGGGRFRNLEGNYRDMYTEVLRDMKFVRGFATFPFDGATPAPGPQPQPSPQPQPAPKESDLTEKLMNAPVLTKGSRDRHHVGIMQSLLTWHAGDLTGDKDRFVDGDFGDRTDQVLRAWQSRTGVLVSDGECGPKTWAWLCGV